MKALSTQEDPSIACTPFDARRSGFVMGEGAGALMLEEYEHAVARGAKIYGELCGYGVTCDAYHITAPQPDGLGGAAALKMALEEAGGCEDYSKLYINAHGTSTPLNDACETKAIKTALGEEAARQCMVSSTKSMTGHMLGAAGAVEAIACVPGSEGRAWCPPPSAMSSPTRSATWTMCPTRPARPRWTWPCRRLWALAATTPILLSGGYNIWT